jgi:hypothetical protein
LRPVQTCSNPGVGHYEVQQAVLNGPSLYSEFPRVMNLLTTRSYERYACTFYGTTPRVKNPRPTVMTRSKPKYRETVVANTNPWIETMKLYTTKILGSFVLGAKTLALLSAVWAPNTAVTCGGSSRRYFDFYDEHILAPLASTPAHMARYVAWLGQLGIIKSSTVHVGSQRLFHAPRPRSSCPRRPRR